MSIKKSLLFLFLLSSHVLASEETFLYVSPDGLIENDCSEVSPCTLEAARQRVRQINQAMAGHITVFLKDGLYQREETFTLTAEDSGFNGYQVRWQAAEGANPLLSSAHSVEDSWQKADIFPERNIWKVSVGAAAADDIIIWFDGKARKIAESEINPAGFLFSDEEVQVLDPALDIESWPNPESIQVGKRDNFWVNTHCVVDDYDASQSTWHIAEFCRKPHFYPSFIQEIIGWAYYMFTDDALNPFSYTISNALYYLDEPGEWYFDKLNREVYYIPYQDENLHEMALTYGNRLVGLIHLAGSMESPVHDIVISGLMLGYSNSGGIMVDRGNGIEIRENIVLNTGGTAIRFDLGGQDIIIENNAIGNTNFGWSSGIDLSQSNVIHCCGQEAVIHPSNADKFYDNVVIQNNYIKKAYAGINVSQFARNLKILSNETVETTNAGISVAGSWYQQAWMGHLENVEIAWNRIDSALQGGMSDHGALYLSSANTGSNRIHHNFINGLHSEHAYGIYLDVFSTQVNVERNLSKGMPWTPFISGWLGMQISTGNYIHHNWSDSPAVVDSDIRVLRFLPQNWLWNNFYLSAWTEWLYKFLPFLFPGYGNPGAVMSDAGIYGDKVQIGKAVVDLSI